MKKFVAIALTVATLSSLCSCFGESTNETEPEEATVITSHKESESATETATETDHTSQTETEPKTETETETTTMQEYKTEEITQADTETETEIKTEEKTIAVNTLDEVDALLSNIVIFKFNSQYAVINGKRIDMGAPALFDENALFPADFVEEHRLGEIKSEDTLERDGIRYVKLEAFQSACKNVKLLVGDMVIVSDTDFQVSADIMDEYVRRLYNTYAIGQVFSAKMKGDRPVLFETDDMLETAKTLAEQKKAPYYSYWLQIKSYADTALLTDPIANKGASATSYRLDACKDMLNARYLALAYRYTEDTKYLDGAVRYLMTYAEQKLGTDKYLDYSAPKGDGQADIGLNIAAPLTAACDVYAILYNHLETADKTVIEDWIREEADLCVKGHKYWIKNKYYGAQYGNNHLTSHLMGIIASAYVLEDDELLSYAVAYDNNPACLQEMMTQAILMEGDEVYGADIDSKFVEGEIYDRYRSCQQNGFGYSMYHLKFLTYSGIMLYHNGLDLFSFTGENGENLLLPYQVYSEYLIKNDITLNGGHYANDKSLNRENAYSTYSIAYYVYKDETVKSVLDALAEQNVRCIEIEVLGISGVYLFGTDN